MSKKYSQLCDKEIVTKAKIAMQKHSYFLIPNAYSKEFCDEIKAEIDKVRSELGVEINYGGSETRIWSAQKRFRGVKLFFDDSNKLISLIFKKEEVAGTVLAIKNIPLLEENQKHITGRWHADSWSSQKKVFLFLSDTTEKSGPLEFIPNTHKFLFRLRKTLEPGFFFNYSSIFKKSAPRPYESIADHKIESLFVKGYKAKPVLVKAGTLLIIDTAKLIHRARPCKESERYALTAYYSVPKGFHDYNV
jgi:ectoine hydroxylase-related dioxygenase (phytanoyl-CoA dioxygenase family)